MKKEKTQLRPKSIKISPHQIEVKDMNKEVFEFYYDYKKLESNAVYPIANNKHYSIIMKALRHGLISIKRVSKFFYIKIK